MINGLCWPGMVSNQRQLFIVVSDWGSYLGSQFLIVLCGILSTDPCVHTSSVTFSLCFIVLFGEFRFIKICGTLHTLRLGPIIMTSVTST